MHEWWTTPYMKQYLWDPWYSSYFPLCYTIRSFKMNPYAPGISWQQKANRTICYKYTIHRKRKPSSAFAWFCSFVEYVMIFFCFFVKYVMLSWIVWKYFKFGGQKVQINIYFSIMPKGNNQIIFSLSTLISHFF